MSNNLKNTKHIGKVVCVGRNYADHAKELGNDVPNSPILFIKPSSAIVSIANKDSEAIHLPSFGGACHFEAELCVQVGQDLSNASLDEVKNAISGVTVGLDLTLRELQTELKSNYQFYLNDELRQQGDSSLMLFPVYQLLVDISHAFGLQAGDVVMTGTPRGVGELQAGDVGKMVLAGNEWQFSVC